MQSPSVLRLAIAAAVSTALFSSTADAHGYLVQPAATSKDTTYNAKIDSSTLPAPYAGKKWNDNPAANAKTFADAFKASGEKSIRAMMDKASPDCGKTSTTGTPIDVSSMKTVKWANDQEKVGFVKSHTGPCETYIDDVMVQQDMECVSKYPMYPADIPVDYSACKGKCVLTFYWLALHEPQWQVYKQCAPITNGGGGGGGGGGAAGGAAGNSTSGGNTGGNNKPPGGNGGNGGGNAPAPVPSKPSNPAPAPAPAPATKPGCKRRVRN